MTGFIEWALFLALATVALTTAAGMLLTMSLYRAGLALMSSFVALAGLFILLDADLMAAIQIMMNVGGMLVMILFMVMIMMMMGFQKHRKKLKSRTRRWCYGADAAMDDIVTAVVDWFIR